MGNDSGGGSNGAEESGARGNALQPGFVALEPRILLDAAALAAAADSIDDDAADSAQPDSLTETENGETGDEVVAALAALSAPAERREVVFVDAKVSDYRALAAGLDAGVELVVLSAEGDGVQQVADYLEGRSGIDAIHLVSHGDVGRIELGDTTLEAGNTDAYADALERIDVALAEAGDILLYGCRIGQDGAGQDFIDGLAQLTGADVAASDDLTGSAALGGDWDLEALSGSIETDNPIARESLTGFDHVLATPVAGFGNALTFDGTNDDVQISANADLALAQNDFTLEAWFKTTETTNTRIDLFGIGHSNTGGEGGFVFIENGLMNFDTNGSSNAVGTIKVNDQQYHHVALVKSGTGTIKIYIDGVFDTSTTIDANPNIANATSYLGSSNGNYFKGVLDEMRIWSDQRTAAEISANIYTPLKGNEAGLIGYWNFDEGSGTNATDRSTNTNDGTLTNGPAYGSASINVETIATGTSSVITLGGSDSDNDGSTQSDTVTPKVATLPSAGTLYQTSDGSTSNGTAISAGDSVSHSSGAVIYVPNESGLFGSDSFTYKVNDGSNDSSNTETATITYQAAAVVSTDFSAITGWTVSGNASHDATNDWLQLTPEAFNQLGMAVFNTAYASGQRFEFEFDYSQFTISLPASWARAPPAGRSYNSSHDPAPVR